MNTLEYREFLPSDFEAVMALELRPIELREGWAAHGLHHEEALALTLASSQYIWVMTYNEKVCGVFGLATHGALGIPWLLSNELPFILSKNRGLFLRTSRQIVMLMQSRVDKLMNIVSLENQESVRWLRWLGFTVDTNNPFTFDRDPDLHFVVFEMRGRGGN
jgi:hypothetical protein